MLYVKTNSSNKQQGYYLMTDQKNFRLDRLLCAELNLDPLTLEQLELDTALMGAAENGSIEKIRELVNAGADPECRDTLRFISGVEDLNGMKLKPFEIASMNDHISAALELLENTKENSHKRIAILWNHYSLRDYTHAEPFMAPLVKNARDMFNEACNDGDIPAIDITSITIPAARPTSFSM